MQKNRRRFTKQVSLIQLQLLLRNRHMGCGAICGNNSSILQPNNYSQNILFKIVPLLSQAKGFIPTRQYDQFLKNIKQNPLKYRLKGGSKLVSKQQIDPGILNKWKVILYCLENSNSNYNNCLRQNTGKINRKKQDFTNQDNFIIDNDKDQQEDNIYQQQIQIYPHKQFSQIEKDIDRTCQLSDINKKTFQRILKRITNQFPQMGYTQGINFIVGYLLMIGYNEFDTFWIFIHIAINPRYLLLGLFEDSFPLSQIYKGIFKNILKRENTEVYQHLYNELNIDQSVWVFKWFFTYFIYSFPHQMIKYVFDIVIQLGGIGLIKFAIAITQEIGKYLLQQTDVCDISIFFQQLKDIHTFNKYVTMSKVIQRAYKLQIKRQDYSFLYDIKDKNFYTRYLVAKLQQEEYENSLISQVKLQKVQINNTSQNNFSDQILRKKSTFGQQQKKIQQNTHKKLSQILLNQWYLKLIRQRTQFQQKYLKSKLSQKDKKKFQRISLQNKLEDKLIITLENQDEIQTHKSPEKQNQKQQNSNSIKLSKNSNKDSNQIKNQTIPSTGYSFNKKSSRLRHDDMVSEIDQLWEQQQKNSSISRNMSSKISQQSRTQNGFNSNTRKVSYQDELDKLASTSNNALGRSKMNYNKTSSIFNNNDKQSNLKPKTKINNFQMISSQKHRVNNLVRAGRNIINNNSSVTDKSIQQSQNSQNSKFSPKQKKQKQTDIYGKGYYNIRKTKQKNLDYSNNVNQNDRPQYLVKSIDNKSSSKDSGFDPRQSYCESNQSIQDQIRNHDIQACSMKAFQSNRERIATQQDIVMSSMHASHIKQTKNYQNINSNNSEIQIFQAQVFKKKNRVSSRINGAMNNAVPLSMKSPKLIHKTSQAGIQKGQKIVIKTIAMGMNKMDNIQSHLNYQQSCESIFDPSQSKRSNNSHLKEQAQKFQIESVR